MRLARLTAILSTLSLAIGCYVLQYCAKKSRRAASSYTTVGIDVVVLVYLAVILSSVSAIAVVFWTREKPMPIRVLSIGAATICVVGFAFWTFLHLSGKVVGIWD